MKESNKCFWQAPIFVRQVIRIANGSARRKKVTSDDQTMFQFIALELDKVKCLLRHV